MKNSVHFFVPGTPAQMGSKKGFVINGRVNIVDDNSNKRKNWAASVSQAAYNAMQRNRLDVFHEPVIIGLEFSYIRPDSHCGTGKNAGKLKASAPRHKSTEPDLDKLIRCVLDALTKIVYVDDRRVVRIDACKVWGEQEGLSVEVYEQH